jgi:RPA family protein
MAEEFTRQVAYKVWIQDIINGAFTKNTEEQWSPNYVEVNGKKISRVNIIASVVGKFLTEDENYGTLTLDDSSETIRVKSFGPDVSKVKKARVGKLIRFIGKVKEYNGEIYLSPEAVWILDDPNWVTVRKLELGKYLTVEKDKEITIAKDVAEEIIKDDDESLTKRMIALINKYDDGKGAPIDKIIEDSKLDEDEVKNAIIGLLKNGEIFEPRKGKLKVLD